LKLSRNKYLKSIGMYKIFSEHMEELRILFDGGDLGEACAIAMAKTLGCACLVTDDIKERGPYYTLMKTLDSEVIPFTFYEILFPDYLEARMSENELLEVFDNICAISELPWDILSKLKLFIKRFWINPYNKNEVEWMRKFCNNKGITDPRARIAVLRDYINKRQ
jgi:hypothetical protein